MDKAYRWAAVVALVAVTASLAAVPALAGSEGRRNSALVLGGAAIYEWMRGEKTAALVLGAGAVVAYDRYQDAREQEKRDAARYDGYGDPRYYGYQRCSGCNARTYCNQYGYCDRCEQQRLCTYNRYQRCQSCRQNSYCNCYGYCMRCQQGNRYPDRGDGQADRRYSDGYRQGPPGWDRGRKTGWDGYRVPPGLRR